MAKSLQTRSSVSIAATFAKDLDINTVSYPLRLAINHVLGSGTGANQANQAFSDARSINASSSENLDLSGSLVDAFGDTIAFTKVKLIAIVADATNVNDVVVGGAASNAFATPFGDATDTIKVKPGGALLLVAPDANGYAVAAGTGDILKVANSGSGSAVGYKIILIGVA